jgi:hypothetical protein
MVEILAHITTAYTHKLSIDRDTLSKAIPAKMIALWYASYTARKESQGIDEANNYLASKVYTYLNGGK